LGEGNTFVSRIHVDDLVAAIVAAARAPHLPRDIYNVADDAPTTSRQYADAVAALLGLPPPPTLPPEQATPTARALLEANRRISNARIKQELGVVLSYPSWREGVEQALREQV
jgi:nucleoside-diphosphate-sugar epimerase